MGIRELNASAFVVPQRKNESISWQLMERRRASQSTLKVMKGYNKHARALRERLL